MYNDDDDMYNDNKRSIIDAILGVCVIGLLTATGVCSVFAIRDGIADRIGYKDLINNFETTISEQINVNEFELSGIELNPSDNKSETGKSMVVKGEAVNNGKQIDAVKVAYELGDDDFNKAFNTMLENPKDGKKYDEEVLSEILEIIKDAKIIEVVNVDNVVTESVPSAVGKPSIKSIRNPQNDNNVVYYDVTYHQCANDSNGELCMYTSTLRVSSNDEKVLQSPSLIFEQPKQTLTVQQLNVSKMPITGTSKAKNTQNEEFNI